MIRYFGLQYVSFEKGFVMSTIILVIGSVVGVALVVFGFMRKRKSSNNKVGAKKK